MNTLSGFESYYPNTLSNLPPYSDFNQSTYLAIDGSNNMIADLDMGNHNIKNLATAISNDEAVNLGQLNTKLLGYVNLTTNQTIGGIKRFYDITTGDGIIALGRTSTSDYRSLRFLNNLGGNKWIFGNEAEGDENLYLYKDSSTKILSIDYASPSLSLNSYKITNVANGTASTDAVNLGQLTTGLSGYVDLVSNQTITGAKTFQSAGTSTQKLILDRTSGTIDNVVSFTTPSGINWLMGQSGGSDEFNFFRYNGFAYFNKMRISNLTTEIFTELIMASNKITSLANGTNANDAVNKSQLDTKLNLSGGTLTGALSMNTTNKITNVADPTNNQDAATKKYVDDKSTAVKSANFTYDNEDIIYWNSSVDVSCTINALSSYNNGKTAKILIENTSSTNTRLFSFFLPAAGSDTFVWNGLTAYQRSIPANSLRIIDLTFNNFNGSPGSIWTNDAVPK